MGLTVETKTGKLDSNHKIEISYNNDKIDHIYIKSNDEYAMKIRFDNLGQLKAFLSNLISITNELVLEAVK